MSPARADVLVLVGSLDVTVDRLRALEALLSQDERDRAAALRIDRVRRRFIASRGLLREALGRESGTDPRSLQFSLGLRGKPSLESPRTSPPIEFNLSHSEDILVIAIARGRTVGVDVEVARPDADIEGLAIRFFSPRERDSLLALDPAERTPAFFACWTRKEAYIKARGEGMSIPLDRFDVSFAPGQPPALLEDRGDARAPCERTLLDLTASVGAAAALAVETRDGSLPVVLMGRLR